MAKAKLSDEVKTYIVQALACFDSPSVVAAAVKKEFGVDVSRQLVQSHEPNKKAESGRAPPQNHAVPALARPIWRADDGAGRGRRAVPCCYAGNSIINWDRDFFVMDESGKKARRV